MPCLYDDMTISQAKSIIQEVFGGIPVSFTVRFWDGSEETVGSAPAFTLIFRDADTFGELFRSQDSYKFAVAYVEDRFEIEGDFFAALRLKNALKFHEPRFLAKLKVGLKLGLAWRHTRDMDRKNVQAHYDVSNEFYKLFLDTRVMAYSCAYFRTPADSLEDAEEAKVDLICRKLRLQTGEALLDIGCGWGGLLMHAATHYGVKGHGVTLSQNQLDLATARVREAGLADKVTIELRDYRDLADASFDKIASVGMYEHVGIKHYPEYFGAAHRLLKPGGLFLNHGITVRKDRGYSGDAKFLATYIFPNCELDDISHSLTVMEDMGFEVLNVESLRPHYALTLHEWWKRLTANEAHARELAPPHVVRAWKLYLAGCALAFEDGRASIHQALLSKSGEAPAKVPLTPHDVYC